MKKSMYTERQEIFQGLLRQVRIEAGLNQSDLAQLLSTAQTRISDYERGQRRIDVVQLEEYLKPLHLTLRQFITRYEEMSDSVSG